MKINSISFSNYKAFKSKQSIELKPITLLIGKNSSGKSSIAKLFTLLENSLSGNHSEPLTMSNSNVVLGGEFRDLVYNRQPFGPIDFSLNFDDNKVLEVSVLAAPNGYELIIVKWKFTSANYSLDLTFTPAAGYTDLAGESYNCLFKGFVPVKLEKQSDGQNILDNLQTDFNIDVDYIGPFRILPDRQFHLIGKMEYEKTGVKGEFAYPLLGVSEYLKKDLHIEVGAWYKDHFNGWELKLESKNKPFIEVVLEKGDSQINIVDVGQGMNQALPLVVRSHIPRKGSIIVLEQPELHLHPAAHADLAELFAKSAKKYGQNFVIETHAENIILRLRKLIVENDFGLTENDVIIYWVEDAEMGGQEVTSIQIDTEGVLSDWPEGVFNENIDEILEIKNALKRKKAAAQNDL